MASRIDPKFPVVDLHVHLEHGLTLEKALELSKAREVDFGIVEHGGYGCRIGGDEDLLSYLGGLKGRPVYRGMQAEGRDWMHCFSREAIDQLDYVLTDALTFPDGRGEMMQLWRPEVRIDDRQDFMKRYVDFHVLILANEPIDIMANPTFLPRCMAEDYDALWTEERMDRIVQAAVKQDVALEINSRYRVPSPVFIGMAQSVGARFSFGSNHHGEDVGKVEYCLEMAERFGLTENDLFLPSAAWKGI